MKRKKLAKLPGVANSRFLLSLLKVVIHGGLDVVKLSKINVLLHMLDLNYYASDPEVFSLIKSIEIAIENKATGITDRHLIMSAIEVSITHEDNRDYLKDVVEPLITGHASLHESEIQFVIGTISTYSKIGFLLDYEESFMDKFTAIKSGSIRGIDSVVDEFSSLIVDLNTKLHKTLQKDDLSTSEPISLNDPDFMDKHFKLVHAMSKRKSKCLKTGLRMFNDFLSYDGGFLTGKMYLINAPTNSFKTGLLLYIAKWVQLYNSDKYIEKYNETKRIPTIIVVSLENTWDENTERLFSMYAQQNMSEVPDLSDAENIWKNQFYKTDSIIDIVLIYGKANRFSPIDLEMKTEELESQNRDVILIVTDYLKIMRDDGGNVEPRMKVISIATDLYSMTTTRPNTCMISAHHTNRGGDEIMTDNEARGGVDHVKLLGRQHLTEAHGIEDAPDFSFYINPETSHFNGKRYLTFKKGKCRYARTDCEGFAHELKNRFYITDDIMLDAPMSISSIAETANEMRSGSESVRSADPNANNGGGSKGKVSHRNSEASPIMATSQSF